jgi:8-oxo-dGTP pyrophosphatase MutT (NUDIX family)
MTDYEKAGALILNTKMNRCLMVYQKSSSLWGIPKGRREGNEDSYSCMIREVKEEIGLDLHTLRIKIIDKVRIHDKAIIYIIKLYLYPLPICSPPYEEGNENHEIEKIEWVPLDKAYKRKNNSVTNNTFYRLKSILKKNIL